MKETSEVGYKVRLFIDPESLQEVVLKSDYDNLKASHKKLVEALKPFAALVKEINELRHEDDSTCPWRLCARDIRKAQRALAEAEGRQ